MITVTEVTIWIEAGKGLLPLLTSAMGDNLSILYGDEYWEARIGLSMKKATPEEKIHLTFSLMVYLGLLLVSVTIYSFFLSYLIFGAYL